MAEKRRKLAEKPLAPASNTQVAWRADEHDQKGATEFKACLICKHGEVDNFPPGVVHLRADRPLRACVRACACLGPVCVWVDGMTLYRARDLL